MLFQSNLCLTLVATYGTIIYFLFFFLGLIMIVIDMGIQWAFWFIDLLLINRTILTLGLDIVCLYVIVLIMHSKSDIGYRSMHTTRFRALNRLVIILLGKVSWHVIFSGFIVRFVIDCTLVEMLCQSFLLIINFATSLDRTWEVLASFFGIGFKFFLSLLKLIIILINNINHGSRYLLWSIRS